MTPENSDVTDVPSGENTVNTEDSGTGVSETVGTGDSRNVAIPMAVMVICVIAAAVEVTYEKRRKKRV